MASIGPDLPPHLLQRKADARSTTPPTAEDSQPGPSTSIGPQTPVHFLKSQNGSKPTPVVASDDDDEDAYGPALPPHLASGRSKPAPAPAASTGTERRNRTIGPALPGHDRSDGYDLYDLDEDDVGPMPLPVWRQKDEGDGVQEFIEREERRRLQAEEAAKPKALKREEWMLVPPSSSDALSSLSDPTKLKARQFSRNAQSSRSAANNLWTETPVERQQRIADEVAGKRQRAVNVDVDAETEVEARKRRKYDEEVRRVVESHNKSSRDKTLLDMHASASNSKEAQDEEKQNAIWDHSRDMSLGGRLMDDKDRNKMIQNAKSLGDRFGSGKGGSFL